MSFVYYALPKVRVEADPTSSAYVLDPLQLELNRVENAVDVLNLVFDDADGDIFNNKLQYNTDVALYVHFDDNPAVTPGTFATTDLQFYGFVEDLTPVKTSSGSLLNVRLRHYSRCLLDLACAQEYGVQSSNPTLDELHEILTDGTYGIVPNYVNEILNSGTGSGYSVDSTYVEPDTDAINYIYFPYKPVKNCLDDLQDVFQALQGASTAGWHWIARTIESPANTFTTYFCLGQVGDHKAGPPDVASMWPSWALDTANLTVVSPPDQITQAFEFRRPEANYIVYAGRLRKPGDGDSLTENHSSLWTDINGDVTLSDESGAGNYRVNSYSLKAVWTSVGDDGIMYPASGNLNWEVNNWGGRFNIPTLSFWIKSNKVGATQRWYIALLTDQSGAGGSFHRSFDLELHAADSWYHLVYPIGPYAPLASASDGDGDYGWYDTNGEWDDVDIVQIWAEDGDQPTFYIDGFEFGGWVVRVAQKASETYTKMKITSDDVGKDDSGIASDDSYLMAQMAYGELLRSARRPLQGQIAISGQPDVLAGQKLHVHAVDYSSGYRVDKTMRIPQHRFVYTRGVGAMSYFSLTDDLINGRPMPFPSPYNLVLAASNPDFQTRQTASIKTRDIDITQSRLVKSYTFNDYF